jgi:hypothetical protein
MFTKTSIPYGSDASAGTYECVDCGQTLDLPSVSSLPPCPNSDDGSHTQHAWRAVSGQGDAVDDPYPEKKKKAK